MSFKETFENHPLIWGCSLFGSGFLVALAIFIPLNKYRSNLNPTKPDPVISTQVKELTENHDALLAKLQKELLIDDEGSTDLGNLDTDKQSFAAAEKQIRESIAEENESYYKQLEKLAILSGGNMDVSQVGNVQKKTNIIEQYTKGNKSPTINTNGNVNVNMNH